MNLATSDPEHLKGGDPIAADRRNLQTLRRLARA